MLIDGDTFFNEWSHLLNDLRIKLATAWLVYSWQVLLQSSVVEPLTCCGKQSAQSVKTGDVWGVKIVLLYDCIAGFEWED